MQVTVFANELSLVPIKLWSYTHIAFAGKGSSLYDRTTTKAPLYTAKPSTLKCLVYEKVSPLASLTHPVKSGKRLLETENTIIQLLVRLWWQGAPPRPIWLNTIAAIRGYWTLRESVSNWTFLYTRAVGNFLILFVSLFVCLFRWACDLRRSGCLIAGIAGSNPAEGTDVRVLCMLCFV